MSTSKIIRKISRFSNSQRRELVSLIGEEFKEVTDFHLEYVYENSKTISDWLSQNDYDGEISFENIKNFIKEKLPPKQFEEFYSERIPEENDEENEIENLERIRDEINARIEELQEQQIFQQQQQEQQQLEENYDKMYEENISKWTESAQKHLDGREEINKIMKSLYEKPFDTDIPLKKLSVEQCEDLAPLLKEWFENVIKKQPLEKKISVEFTVNGEKIFWTINKENVMKKLSQIFNGDFSFNIEQLPSLRSDDDSQISITWMDNICFKVWDNSSKKQGERSHKPSAFFEYRLKKEFAEFEEILSRYQIFTHLDNDKHTKCREELKYNCLIYALKTKIHDKDTLAKMSNYFLGISHIPSHMLNDFCKSFNINIILYSYNENGRLRKMNDKNGGKFGGENPSQTFTLATFKNHFFLYEEVPVSNFYLKNMENIKKYASEKKWDMKKCWIVCRKSGNNYRIDSTKSHMSSLEFVKRLMEMNAFEPLYRSDRDVDIAGVFHHIHSKQDIQNLAFSEEKCCQKIQEKKKGRNEEKIVYYADFETCYNKDLNQEVEFMLCVQDMEGNIKKTFIGKDCGRQFLEYIPDKSIVYFHNLGFDGRLLMKYGVKNNIIKGSKIIQQTNTFRGKTIILRDSYSMFTQKLANFPKCFPEEFKGLHIQKELFPYRYYNYERVFSGEYGVISECGREELPQWNDSQKEIFRENISKIPGCKIDENHFDMMKYCEFYCQQDVNVLRIGFNAFRESALKEPISLDIFEYLTAPSLAQAYLNREVFVPNGNLFMLSGHVRDFIMKAIYGGRCMTKQNKRWRITEKLDDFDACSLYPSAMARLFTVEGSPKVLSEEMLNRDYLFKHSFTEDQTEKEGERYISYYIVEIEIKKVGIERDFPLIVERTKTNNMNVNKSCRMILDMIELEDKVKFQNISFDILRGYYWTGNRDHRIRETIRKLFSLRAQYKKQGNSIQQIIKLIMNSGYGKSIQKPIENELKYIPEEKIDHYVFEHWHNIQECRKIPHSKQYLVKISKIVDKQFNNCVFGVSVLSMSKRIMNEVMCLAEDLGINIYYQDTDSMHIEHDKIDILAKAFREKYGRDLIGEDTIGCFHNDFDELHDAFTTLHISLGKKMYYDELSNSHGEHAEHFRMKGIPNAVIIDHARKYFENSVKNHYEFLYEGNEITFDLNSVAIRFDMQKTGEISHKNKFLRKIKATSPKNF